MFVVFVVFVCVTVALADAIHGSGSRGAPAHLAAPTARFANHKQATPAALRAFSRPIPGARFARWYLTCQHHPTSTLAACYIRHIAITYSLLRKSCCDSNSNRNIKANRCWIHPRISPCNNVFVREPHPSPTTPFTWERSTIDSKLNEWRLS